MTSFDADSNYNDVTASHGDSTTSWIDNDTNWTKSSVDDAMPPLLSRYSIWYASYHGYVSLVVCAVGIVGNAFNVVVLTRPSMARSSTNCILTALAVSDLLTMVVYVPFAVQFYCRRPPAAADTTTFTPNQANTLGWTAFLLFYVHTSVTAHTVSIWLAVVLSVYRYAYVRPRSTATFVSGSGGGLRCVRWAIVAIYVFAVVILVPNYLSYVVRRSPTANYNGNHVSPIAALAYPMSGILTGGLSPVHTSNSVKATFDFVDATFDCCQKRQQYRTSLS